MSDIAPVMWTLEHLFNIENPIHVSCFHYLQDVNDNFLIYIGMTSINHPEIGQPAGFQFLPFVAVAPVLALLFPDDFKNFRHFIRTSGNENWETLLPSHLLREFDHLCFFESDHLCFKKWHDLVTLTSS